jgi:hypothetical protein
VAGENVWAGAKVNAQSTPKQNEARGRDAAYVVTWNKAAKPEAQSPRKKDSTCVKDARCERTSNEVAESVAIQEKVAVKGGVCAGIPADALYAVPH